LTELDSLLEFAPNIFGGFNLRASAACGRDKRTGIHRRDHGARNRTSISLEFCGEGLKRFVYGLAMNPGEHFLMEVCVLDTRDAG
jgi:hypothetical protein